MFSRGHDTPLVMLVIMRVLIGIKIKVDVIVQSGASTDEQEGKPCGQEPIQPHRNSQKVLERDFLGEIYTCHKQNST